MPSMITFSAQAIEQWSKTRPPGYADDVYAAGEVTRNAEGVPQSVSLTEEAYKTLCRKYRGSEPAAAKVARKPQPPALAREADPVSWLQKAKNFATATAQHIAAGMPTASDEEILRRWTICQGCEFLKNDACSKCGCPVARDRKFVSKLAWADQSCPVGKWGPAAG